MKNVCIMITIVLAVYSTFITFALSKVKQPYVAMAMGLDEEKNVWNRIRVDEKGRVMCAPK